jgi:hypothetical protein
VKSQHLTVSQHAEIAGVLHEALIEAGPPEDQECVHAWNAVRDVSARLCALFDNDPGFDYQRFIATVMNGKAE